MAPHASGVCLGQDPFEGTKPYLLKRKAMTHNLARFLKQTEC